MITHLINPFILAVIASGAKQSRLCAASSGLPRCARNDGYRHAELVSASMPQWWGKARIIQSRSNVEAWVLKQVQDDGGVWA
jgi:hypothetical protein